MAINGGISVIVLLFLGTTQFIHVQGGWQDIEKGVAILYADNTTPIQFTTSVDGTSGEVWIYFQYRNGWSQIRWQMSDYAVDLYPCTDDTYRTTTAGDIFTNVPDDVEKRWELGWTNEYFTVKCNDVTVWTFDFSNQVYPECVGFFNGANGDPLSFAFDAQDTVSETFYDMAAIVECDRPTIPHGNVAPYGATIQEGEDWEIQCDGLYKVKSGSANATCQADGTLDEIPICEEIRCAKPSITDGSVSPSDETIAYVDTYEVTCNAGFTMSGGSTMMCLFDETFSNETTTCESNAEAETCWTTSKKHALQGTKVAKVYKDNLDELKGICGIIPGCNGISCHKNTLGCTLLSDVTGTKKNKKYTAHQLGPCAA